MSKQKNKKNKAATPKEPITRRDLCVRIHALEKENADLQFQNKMLSMLNDAQIANTNKGIELVKKSDANLAVAIRVKNEYQKMNRVLILALILSGLFYLIDLFI